MSTGPTASALLDSLTSVDDVLRDDVAPKLAEISQAAEAQSQALQSLTEAVGVGDAGGVELGGQFTQYPHEASANVPADTSSDEPVTRERTIDGPFELVSVIMGWPDGADNFLGIAVKTASGENIIPRNSEDEYIAANDFTGEFTIRRAFEDDDTLVAEYINNDTGNSHFGNVIMNIRRFGQ